MRDLTLYKTSEWISCQYDDTTEKLNNKTAIVVKCTQQEIDKIMHTKPFKEIQPMLTRFYNENTPQEQISDKFKLIRCSKKIYSIIKWLWWQD